MPPQTLAYLSLAFVFAVTPGATTAVIIRQTLDGGRRRGITASLGAISASAIHASLALLGISTLLVRWPGGLKALALAGGGFLAWLGVKSLRSALGSTRDLRGPGPSGPGMTLDLKVQGSRVSPYREGFTINILNPSVASFYIGVTPTFVPAGSGWTALAFLYTAHIAIVFFCHVFWSLVFNQARTLFAGERPRRWLDAAVGVLLIALAWRIVGKF